MTGHIFYDSITIDLYTINIFLSLFSLMYRELYIGYLP